MESLSMCRTDNGGQFISKFFEMLCAILCKEHLTTMMYQAQMKGQAGRFNNTIIARLRRDVA